VLTPFADVPDKFAGRHQVTYVRHDLLDEEGLQNKLDTRPPMLRQYMGPQGSPEPLYVQGQTIVPLSELAFRVEGLIKPTPDERLPVLRVLEPSDLLQNRTQNGTLRGPDEPYQAFVFRVVEVQPSGPPASLDEVRDQVVADYRLLKAYELAGRYAEELGARARVEGLAAAAAGMTELKALLQAADENWTPPADREQAARTAPHARSRACPHRCSGSQRIRRRCSARLSRRRRSSRRAAAQGTPSQSCVSPICTSG